MAKIPLVQRALEAGVLDEVQLHLVPVLFGGGLRLFDVLPDRVELDITRVIDTPEATHLRYLVRQNSGSWPDRVRFGPGRSWCWQAAAGVA